CSMSALGEIANGVSKNLLGRAADVCIKEGRRLIIVPRETPISPIHLKNMLTLSQLGVTMMAAMPGFYNRPKTLEDIINFVVGRVLSGLGIENNLYLKWGNDI
ncbi:MAG: aromatic acid decarboxylase, partial [Clostridiales bacterium]|nr:aromatic acid decarboxylase [Clostridiales bacterium]